MEKLKIHQLPDVIQIYMDSDFLLEHKMMIVGIDKEKDKTFIYDLENGPVRKAIAFNTGVCELMLNDWGNVKANTYVRCRLIYDAYYKDELEKATQAYYLLYPVDFPINNYCKYKKVKFGNAEIPVQMALLTNEVFDESIQS